MGLADIVRSGVAVANTLTQDLQVTVVREAAILPITQDVRGEVNRSAGVNVKAIVEYAVRLVRVATGEMVVSRAKVTFLTPIAIHPKDRLTLPDGSKGPILETEGLADSATGANYMTEVFIGSFK